ncbi:MAG: hypothetical protein LZF85_07940 [Nitrosomonas sp.]|uniref:hypothetical protein n=1 Tax=Nitrosomonas sp. TaxID=42353 RepID=UPI001A5149BA|nr:hypothetical protein [Nitrosomonas sp.]MBL8500476.1 hypothetical protein [Nitrosomonas sp.]UJP01729.1 MAG: hypothetical protein LZF85_07940 [Nitrosomonas sp.]
MKTIDLANGLGISAQMTNRLIKQGMPRELDLAIAWRKSNLQPFRTKSTRIGGNSGKPYQSVRVNETTLEDDRACSIAERKIIEKTLTSVLPNLYFERVDWLTAALKEASVPVTGKQVIEIQDSLLSTYMEEIIYGYLQSNNHFELPPLFEMRLDSKERKAVIASIDQLLSQDSTAE